MHKCAVVAVLVLCAAVLPVIECGAQQLASVVVAEREEDASSLVGVRQAFEQWIGMQKAAPKVGIRWSDVSGWGLVRTAAGARRVCAMSAGEAPALTAVPVLFI